MIPAPDGYFAVFTDADGKEVRRAPVLAWSDEGDPMVASVPTFTRLVWADTHATEAATGDDRRRDAPVGGRMTGEVFARIDVVSNAAAGPVHAGRGDDNAEETAINWVVLLHRPTGEVEVLDAYVYTGETGETDARETFRIFGDGDGKNRHGERVTIATVQTPAQ